MSFDRDQPRDDHGRFSGGDWAERRAGKLAGALTNKADKEGGFSYRTGGAKEDRVPKTGFMVSVPKERGLNHVIDIKEMANRDPPPTATQLKKEIVGEVHDWLEKTLPAIKDDKDHYLGGWMERHEGGAPVALHLDVSQRFTSKDEAIKAGKARNQMAIWHLDKSEEISTGGTGR